MYYFSIYYLLKIPFLKRQESWQKDANGPDTYNEYKGQPMSGRSKEDTGRKA